MSNTILTHKLNLPRRVSSILFVTILIFLALKTTEDIFLILLTLLLLFSVIFDYLRNNTKNKFILFLIKKYPIENYEKKRIYSDLTIFVVSLVALFFIFDAYIFVAGILIYVLADNLGHLMGVLFHKGKLFWNNKKCVIGMVGTFLGTILAFYILNNIIFVPIDITVAKLVILALVLSFVDTLNIPDNELMVWISVLFIS